MSGKLSVDTGSPHLTGNTLNVEGPVYQLDLIQIRASRHGEGVLDGGRIVCATVAEGLSMAGIACTNRDLGAVWPSFLDPLE